MRRDDLLLLERQREQAVLSSVLAGLRSARPGVVHIAGRPGHGQGALLRWAARLAKDRGFRVLTARATPAESDLRYGAILQLLTPLCELAESSLKTFIEHEQPDLLPGLTESLPVIRETPTVLIVEDVQWLDGASLCWLEALIRRLFTGTPVALVTSGTGVAGRPDWLGGAHATPIPTTELVLRPTTRRGVATAVRMACGAEGDEDFTAAAEEATGSSPLVLHDALRHFADQGYEPVAERIPELTAMAARFIGDHAARSLSELPREALEVLRAVAVCGDLLDFCLVCTLAGPRSEPESGIRAILEAAGLTTSQGPSVRIRFPVVKGRVLEDMPAEERADLYTRAAELAHRAAVQDDDIATLLFQAPPLGAPWVTAALRRSATAALWRGDYERATTCLSRALLEPMPPPERDKLNLELAETEMVIAPEAGERRLSELARVVRGTSAVNCLRPIDVGLARGNEGWALRAAAEALPLAEGSARDDLIALHWFAWQHCEYGDDDLLLPEVPPLPEYPVTPAQAGVVAWRLAARGENAEGARALARRALAAGTDAGALVMPRLAACEVLSLTDDGEEALNRIDELLSQVRRGSSRAATARALSLRAALHLRGGRFDAAERDTVSAEAALPPASWHPLAAPYQLALRIAIALETGAYDEARALAALPAHSRAQEGVALSCVLFARARVAALDGRWWETLALARECGRRLSRCQWINPGLMPWRSLAARAAQMCGNDEEATRLSGEEQALARRWGTASAISIAELGAGPLTLESPATPMDVKRLPDGPDYLAYAWGLTELAAAELGRGHPQAAARLLPGLTRFTATYPSSRLARRVRALTEELERPGSRELPETWITLTDAERATAELAGEGYGNRQIAELLSVSRRTVELRLSSTYRKLHVSGRGELRALMDTMEGRPTDAA
jgi:DNA-binding CsgD family transcriptional regulator/tetratricopeptide (TPR) repeat protein